MRFFIAVDPGDQARADTAALIARLKAANPKFKWVRPEKVHLTLSFQDRRAEDQIHDLEAAMAEAAKTAPFDAELGGLGGFPSSGAARVLWVGLSRGKEGFAALAQKLAFSLERRGLLPDDEKGRPYVPHLTIARMTRPVRIDEQAGLRTAFRVTRIKLYESKGGEYRILRERMLAATS
jgi:RNA 2',3'-cyclic 3'-phosphodiesterase